MNLTSAYRGKSVFVTGHTGFKGAWLSLWLEQMGAHVTGYALAPPTEPSLFADAGVAEGLCHTVADIRDAERLQNAVAKCRPDFVFHLAAQSLVLDSYSAPAETFAINVQGTINLMEALRAADRPVAAVMITTDKVYRNREWVHGYREDDPLGGHDPYSASKAAMELAVATWRDSFFAHGKSPVRMASARAGNVIGGGDWAANRIVPDLARAVADSRQPSLRNPGSLRPWQHVLEPLSGYLQLGARLAGDAGEDYAEAWNFGPLPVDVRSVGELASAFVGRAGHPGWHDAHDSTAPHEAGLLRLSIDKSVAGLGWRPRWDFAQTVARTADWYTSVADGMSSRAACLNDLAAYQERL